MSDAVRNGFSGSLQRHTGPFVPCHIFPWRIHSGYCLAEHLPYERLRGCAVLCLAAEPFRLRRIRIRIGLQRQLQ